MTNVSDAITRNTDLIPVPVASQVLQELPAASAILSRARRVTMSTAVNRLPVLSALPLAYWVSGDDGLKATTKAEWDKVELIAEELAVIVPVPQALLDDSGFPIWNEVRPRIVEAFGAKLDGAALFGTDTPFVSDGIVPEAVAASNEVVAGTGDDLAVDVAAAAQLVAEDGFAANGFASGPGFRWRLVALRSQDGIPIYAPPAGDQPATLFGFPLSEVRSGGWDATAADLVLGDWDKAIVGIRQDMTFQIFDSGVISDDNGSVVYNLMQQDAVALRAVMRVAFATANPVTAISPNGDGYPFAVVTPAGS